MSQQQVKQEPVDLLENDEDDIRSIAGSEWTMDTSATNGGGIETMQTLKLKMRILEVEGSKYLYKNILRSK
jgi:hypothetical protein